MNSVELVRGTAAVNLIGACAEVAILFPFQTAPQQLTINRPCCPGKPRNGAEGGGRHSAMTTI
jgi:hypothetical protein